MDDQHAPAQPDPERSPMPPSVPAGMRLVLHRARLLPGAQEEAERWMRVLHDRYEECVATLDYERVAFEGWFRGTDADGTEWLYAVLLYGESGGEMDPDDPVNQAHVEFAQRCKEAGWEELRPVLMLAPDPVRAALQAWGRHGSGAGAGPDRPHA